MNTYVTHRIIVLAFFILGTTNTFAQGTHVKPDPQCVAVLQGIQDAQARGDQEQLKRLIAPQVPVETYLGGEKMPAEPLQQADFISKHISVKGDSENLSPFIDGVPISKRILWAENIPGGQVLRVVLLNHTAGKPTRR